MAPGVGGYLPETLFAACTAVARSNGPVLLATACRCHAVEHAVHVRSLGTPKLRDLKNRIQPPFMGTI